jgi:hypothetical protein
MILPPVLALPLDEAKRMIGEADLVIAETTISSPPNGSPAGPLRVIRLRQSPDGVHLVVAAALPQPRLETAPSREETSNV